MEIIKEILRLNESGKNNSEIHRATGADRKTILSYLNKFSSLGLNYAEVKEMSSAQLRVTLFPSKEKTRKSKEFRFFNETGS